MAILVTMTVGPVDRRKFQEAIAWIEAQPDEGARSTKVYYGEEDPRIALVEQEWESHDAFHASSDKYGDEFNRRAGTEGLDWRTEVWTIG